MTGGFYTEASQLPKSTTSSTARVPRPKEDSNKEVAAVSMLENMVAAVSTLVSLQNTLERARNPHYPLTSVGGMENPDIRKVNHAKLQRQSVETVESKDTIRKCV